MFPVILPLIVRTKSRAAVIEQGSSTDLTAPLAFRGDIDGRLNLGVGNTQTAISEEYEGGRE